MVSGRCQMVPGRCEMVLERCQMVPGRFQEIPSVYFERFPARQAYLLNDSRQEAFVEHMENKVLHVAILFSPICGPSNNIYSYRFKRTA